MKSSNSRNSRAKVQKNYFYEYKIQQKLVPLHRFFDKVITKMRLIKAKYYLIPAAICLFGILAAGYYFFLTDFSAQEDVKYVYIDDDDSFDSVCYKLKPIASLTGMTGFSVMARHTDYPNHLRTGRYAIEPNMGTFNVLRRLKNGQQEPVQLVIPESRTMDRLAAQLSRKLMLDSAEIAHALLDSEYCAHLGYDTATIACLFVPNTYEVYWNTTLERLMERMQKEHDKFWDGARTAKATETGLTENEICTLASIIDEETANQQEKPMVAGMYLNRLRQNMPLQADPTIKFAMKRFELKRIYRGMLDFDSPWNTYRNTGLPPGPIKIASVQGIDAVLNHVEHDYLYMCANEDFSGTHRFAVTYKEHQENAARYAKALNERGIK